MSNLKIFRGLQHGPQSGETGGSVRSHSGHNPEQHDSRPQISYSHDKTPARQREFESQGFQNRSLFDGPSNQRGHHIHDSQSNGHHHSDDPLGLKGLLNLRQENGSGRGELLSNRNNGRSFAESDQLRTQTNSRVDRGDRGDHGGGRVSKDSGREFDRGWDYRTTDLPSWERHDGVLQTLRDTVRTESNQVRNQLRFLDGDAQSLPPGQAKRWNDNLPSRHHGLDHPQDIDSGMRSTFEDVFRAVNDQVKTVAHDLSKTRGLERWPDYPNRLAYKVDYALENRVLRGGPPDRVVREIASEVATIAQLGKYFSQLESTGGEPVRKAYRAVLDFLLDSGVGDEYDRLRFASELLRDLQSGLFLFREDLEAPFPLTGRARVVSEMIELMRTLDAIEKYTDHAVKRDESDWPSFRFGGLSGLELMAVLGSC
jgi:hypothetical protein